MPIYKYVPAKYLQTFLEGNVLLRSLSYFQDFEDERAIGDRYEGTRSHRPIGGLVITKSTGEKLRMPHAFDSSVNRNDIFVFCTSMAKRRDLAREFESDQCVEIIDPLAFASRLAGALRTARPDWTQLQHRPVFYYRDEDPLGTDWAIPTRIATSKRYLYRRQREYRYVCGPPHVFDVHQTSLQLSPPGSIPPQTASVHGEQIVNVGKLGSICRVHTWPAAQPAAAAAEPQMD